MKGLKNYLQNDQPGIFLSSAGTTNQGALFVLV